MTCIQLLSRDTSMWAINWFVGKHRGLWLLGNQRYITREGATKSMLTQIGKEEAYGLTPILRKVVEVK